LTISVQARREVDAIRPDIDVALAREITLVSAGGILPKSAG